MGDIHSQGEENEGRGPQGTEMINENEKEGGI